MKTVGILIILEIVINFREHFEAELCALPLLRSDAFSKFNFVPSHAPVRNHLSTSGAKHVRASAHHLLEGILVEAFGEIRCTHLLKPG